VSVGITSFTCNWLNDASGFISGEESCAKAKRVVPVKESVNANGGYRQQEYETWVMTAPEHL